MWARKKRWARAATAFLAATMIGLISCNSGGSSTQQPPADVSGVWDGTVTNAGVATLSGCTGDFVSLNGLTIAVVLAAGADCTTSDPFVVTQVNDVFTAIGQSYTCNDGTSFVAAGGGTIAGDSLSGSLDTISSLGFTGKELFDGDAISADTLTLFEYRIVWSGSVSGSCNVNPDLQHHVTISSLVSNNVRLDRNTSDAARIGAAVLRLR
jgi:hypothetical protein